MDREQLIKTQRQQRSNKSGVHGVAQGVDQGGMEDSSRRKRKHIKNEGDLDMYVYLYLHIVCAVDFVYLYTLC